MGTVIRAFVTDWAFQGTRGEGHLVEWRAKPRHAHEFGRWLCWVSLRPHELAERDGQGRGTGTGSSLLPASLPNTLRRTSRRPTSGTPAGHL